MDYPNFIVSNQKEESISIQRVKAQIEMYKDSCYTVHSITHSKDLDRQQFYHGIIQRNYRIMTMK